MSNEPATQLKSLIRENKLAFVGIIAAFIVLPVWTISDINAVEAGTVPRARVVAPVGLIYQAFGYWPAVLFLPLSYVAFGLFIYFRFLRRRRPR